MTIPETFTDEQKEYLQGFFAGLSARKLATFVGVLSDGRITAAPAPGLENQAVPQQRTEETIFGNPVSDLCEQEIWKLEQHGLDVWDKLLAHAKENKFPDKADTFRFRFHGMFYVAQTQNSFMLRCRTPAGRLTANQLRGLAAIADDWGSGDIRLTVWQNLLITNIPDSFVETVKRLLVRIGLHYEANSITGGVIACTGNTGCKFAATNTKGQAVELAKYLEKRVSLDQPINIHLTGCPHSYAQHYIADIGLLGVQVGPSGEQVEGYHVFFGGSSGQNEALGREVFHGVPFRELPALLEKVLKIYLVKRMNLESFKQFVSRREIQELQEIFSE